MGEIGTGINSYIVKMMKEEGLRGFFKGVGSPIVGAAPLNAIIFASNDFC